MWLNGTKHRTLTSPPTWCLNPYNLKSLNVPPESTCSSSSDGLLMPKYAFFEMGIVLPPWLLLSWLQINSRMKHKPRQLPLPRVHASSVDPELPLDLRTRAAALCTLPSKQKLYELSDSNTCSTSEQQVLNETFGTVMKQNRVHCEASSTPFQLLSTFCSVNQTSRPKKNSLPDLWIMDKRALANSVHRVGQSAPNNCLDMGRSKDHGHPKLPSVHRTTMSGPGKQPVTRCYQCKLHFPSLVELNVHFVSEHAYILREEMERTKSWKSHAIEEFYFPDMESHSLARSMNTNGYPCPLCNYCAKWPTELQKHIMVHSKERPHRCIICGLSYKWKWDLGRHFDKSHHKSMNPYKKNGINIGKSRVLSKREQRYRKTTKLQTPVLCGHNTGENNSSFPLSDHSTRQEGFAGYTVPREWNWVGEEILQNHTQSI
ncbi:hypothetical protein CRM22_011048 [Opisthorchis felineus]|uniref:C2H2-type domain-containing protein n=1 Tax=Opisthorchis felineus TaxID=147828 RepID=A0A4S2KD37_OPIFE|nr:hypothetical protein CRM22_011048 [Opisthorchis felineus]